FKNQNDLVAMVKEQFNFDLLKDTEDMTPLEMLTVRWCLENVLPLQVLEPYQYKHRVLKHEDLRSDIQVFLNLCKEFNLEPLSNIDKEYARPSSKTHSKSNIINKNAEIEKFTSKDLFSINRLLEVFGCALYPRMF